MTEGAAGMPPDAPLHARLQRLLGRDIERYVPVRGGYTPAARWIAHTAAGSFFAKQ